jgi:hypothetical protein
MNKKINSLLALALIALMFVASSCGDDDEQAPRTPLLTAHTWKYSTIESSVPGLAITVGALYTGREYTFKTDNTYTGKIFGLETSGTWEFSDGEKKIVIDKGPTEEVFQIDAISSTTLNFKFTQASVSYVIKYVE